MNVNEMSHEELLEAIIADPTNQELKDEALERMNDTGGGFDSEGKSEVDIDFEIQSVVLVEADTGKEILVDLDIILMGTLYHEHGYESQLNVEFEDDSFVRHAEIGDTFIISGYSETLGSKFTYKVTTESDNTYSMSMEGENFSYDMC